MLRKNLLLLLLILLNLKNIEAYSQVLSTKGKDFWLSFMQNESEPTASLYITADVATSGTVEIPFAGWSEEFTVQANSSVQIIVPAALGYSSNSEENEGKGIHVYSANNISVFALNYVPYTADAAIIYPTPTLSNDYYTLSYEAIQDIPGYPSLLMIVGVEDNTEVEVTPASTTTGGKAAGVPYTFVINAGESYQLKSELDLSGSRVRTTDVNKKIAVFGGSTCSFVPQECYACDHLFEQMPPISTWGKQFVSVPLETRNSDLFRIIAASNNTEFTINNGVPINLNAGQYYETTIVDASYYSSNKPILVMQYSRGSDCDGTTADPFMIVINPIEQAIKQITFNAFESDVITKYYCNIVVKSNETDDVLLDGNQIGGFFSEVPSNPTYSFMQINISEGNHTLSSANGVIAYVYGYGEYESFGYPAGTNLFNLFAAYTIIHESDTTFYAYFDSEICVDEPLTFNGQLSDNINSFNWNFGDGNTSTDLNPTHSYNTPGTYSVILHAENDEFGQTFDLESTVKVILCQFDPCDTIETPIISANFTPSTLAACLEGNSISFENNSTNATQYLWDFGDGNTSTEISPTHSYSQGGTYLVSLTARDSTMCYNVSDIETKSIDINYINAQIIKDTEIACVPFTVNYSLNAVGNGTSFTYQWDFGNGNTATEPEALSQYTQAGNYTVNVTITDNIGCSAFASTNITANSISTSINASNTAACINQSVNFTNISTNAQSFFWSFGDNTSSTEVNPNHAYNTPGTYTVTLTASNENGCTQTAQITIEVQDVKADFEASNTQGCAPLNITFNNTSINANNINWNFGDGNTSDENNPMHTFAEAGTYTVTLTVSNQIGCEDMISKTITVFSVANIGELTANNNFICNNNELMASISSTQIPANQSLVYYLHNNPNGNLLDLNLIVYDKNTNGVFTGNYPKNTTLYLTAIASQLTNNNEIDFTYPCLVSSNTVAVVFLKPLLFNVDEHCDWKYSGDYTVTFTVKGGLPEYAPASANYQIFGDYTGTLNYGQSASIVFPEDGINIYELTATDNICNALDTVSPPFECYKTPITLINFAGQTQNLGNQLTWSTASEINNDYFTLLKSTNGINYEPICNINAIKNSTTLQHYQYLDTYAANGTSYYQLQQVDVNGNKTTADNTVILHRNTNTFNLVSVQPIPSSMLVNAVFNSPNNQVSHLKIYDVLGKIVKEQEITTIAGINSININIANLTSGMYLLQLENNQQTIVRKIIKK